MMKPFTTLLILCFLISGCAIPLPGVAPSISGGRQQDVKNLTNVQLSPGNYTVLKTNVVGTDWGFSFLGLIPIVSPD